MAVQLPVAGSYSSALVKWPQIQSPCHQHLAVGQQRRRVKVACGAEAAGRRPASRRRIVQFRAGQSTVLLSPPATSTLPLGSSVAV